MPDLAYGAALTYTSCETLASGYLTLTVGFSITTPVPWSLYVYSLSSNVVSPSSMGSDGFSLYSEPFRGIIRMRKGI